MPPRQEGFVWSRAVCQVFLEEAPWSRPLVTEPSRRPPAAAACEKPPSGSFGQRPPLQILFSVFQPHCFNNFPLHCLSSACQWVATGKSIFFFTFFDRSGCDVM